MRMGLVIVLLAGLAVGLVHVRRAEIITRHEIQQFRMRQVKLRRQLWDQQIRLGLLTAPDKVRRRVEQMKLDLVRTPAEGAPHGEADGSRDTSRPDMRPWPPR